jgi:hypothetical protein
VKKYTATILIADGTPDSSGHALDSELVTWPKDGVPVRMGVGNDAPVIGHAILSRDKFSIVADVELEKDKLGDFGDEEIDKLVPAVVGMGDPEGFDLDIESVALGDWVNVDPRIMSLASPPPCQPDDLGVCAVCGGDVTEEAPLCPGLPMTPEDIGQVLVEATKPLTEPVEALSVTVDPAGQVLDFPVPADQDDATPADASEGEE